jgi:maltooligosyltrehalose trehalohydrolase
MPDGERDYPDPASFYQPEGVHGPSQVIDHSSHEWRASTWRGLPLQDMVLYELHVGAFTREGTFDAVISRLDDLAATGINAIEIMPVAQFPGSRNWGYDGTYPFAVQASYGGPRGLKKLVDACHTKGIAVFLDVVYNHLGPEGNYLPRYAPYFTDVYSTPWGNAINYDGPWSDGVRNYFCCNALYWFRHFNIDGLRLDAIHAIFDFGAVHVFEYIHKHIEEERHRTGRPLYLIAESDLNNPRVVKHPEAGGYGFDAQWLDDFHHSLCMLLQRQGFEQYEHFGTIEQLAKAYTDGFVQSGEFVKLRGKKYGRSSAGISGDRFIAFNQNHDQVGNRFDGARLSALIDLELLKVAAAAVFFAPYIPLLFMGEEYGEDTPFYYFTSHTDSALVAAVREGRKKEFERSKSTVEPPDPQDEQTFQLSKISWEKRGTGKYMIMLEWHRTLIAYRRIYSALKNFCKNDVRVYIPGSTCLVLHRRSEDEEQHLLILLNLGADPVSFEMPGVAATWQKVLDSKEDTWCIDKHQHQLLPAEVTEKQRIEIPPASATVYVNRPEVTS